MPQLWPYEEKVMGWITHPQLSGMDPDPGAADYITPTWGNTTDDPFLAAQKNEIIHYRGPPRGTPSPWARGIFTFCGTQNACSEKCRTVPTTDASCWWHGPVTWIPSEGSTNAATEALAESLGSAEPTIVPAYQTDCPNQEDFLEQFNPGTYVVNTLTNASQNTLGCN